MLTNLFVIDAIPAWATNRLSRLVKSPKPYLVDPALAGAALGLDTSAVLRDGDLLGRLIDTFVVAQLRPERELTARLPRFHHLREKNGRHEIDLIAELGGDGSSDLRSKQPPRRADRTRVTWSGSV